MFFSVGISIDVISCLHWASIVMYSEETASIFSLCIALFHVGIGNICAFLQQLLNWCSVWHLQLIGGYVCTIWALNIGADIYWHILMPIVLDEVWVGILCVNLHDVPTSHFIPSWMFCWSVIGSYSKILWVLCIIIGCSINTTILYTEQVWDIMYMHDIRHGTLPFTSGIYVAYNIYHFF